MLQENAVSPGLLQLLNILMKDVRLNQFILVGGTALALQTGHRKSIDLDLFTKDKFDSDSLNEHLKENYDFGYTTLLTGTLLGSMKGIKVDILQHLYPDLNQPIVTDFIRMASPLDIAAMKIHAIVNKGTRLKDFVDLAYFSSQMPLKQMVQGYEKKYDFHAATAIRALTFFNEINFNESVELFAGNFKWAPFERRLKEMVKYPDTVFPELQMSGPKKQTRVATNDGDDDEPEKKVRKGPKL